MVMRATPAEGASPHDSPQRVIALETFLILLFVIVMSWPVVQGAVPPWLSDLMLMAKAWARHQAQQGAEDLRKSQEPHLKALLLKALVDHTPILVKAPIRNFTETLGGILKSQEHDEIDDAFYNSTPVHIDKTATATMNATFQEVVETIPAGTVLTFKNFEKSLGQLVFQDQNGQDYAIYKDPQVMFQGTIHQNPGFYGLLFNTNLGE